MGTCRSAEISVGQEGTRGNSLTREGHRLDGCLFDVSGNSRVVSGKLGDISALANVLITAKLAEVFSNREALTCLVDHVSNRGALLIRLGPDVTSRCD